MASTFIVTAHMPRPEKAERFEGPDALPPVEWVIGTRQFCEAKVKVWELYFKYVTLRPVGEVLTYGAN